MHFSNAQIDIKSLMVKDGEAKVTGRITDINKQDINKQFIPNAHITFTSLKTEKVTGTTSNEADGKFSIKLSSGDNILQVSALGFSKYMKKHTFGAYVLLPDIVLQEQSEQLDEVVIKADLLKNIAHSTNGMTIHIENDSLYKKISTIEVLAQLPGVRVDDDGSVTLQGIPATITIDGKTQRMSSRVLMMVLKSMQGDRLKNIELINTPSAKYSGRIQKIIDINFKK